ncbi:hypothetical protein R1flu_026983 [Riccia fluitans]|uniref:Uncharacterized protein n=1 Tax=Riccia fluitans TaxID=41844 RepID=A0ABD1XHZ8_9MARC
MEVGLVEFLHGEYASGKVMPVQKDVHGNHMDRRICGDCWPIKQQATSEKYVLSTLEAIFDAVGKEKIFSILVANLRGRQAKDSLLGNQFPWKGLLVPMALLAHWVEEFLG